MTEFRNATRADLECILEWAASEGWNPGLDDAEAFYAADPNGFFVAVKDGTPVASISVVNHSSLFAFLGLYIAAPTHRRQGIGFRLWQHAVNHAEERTIGLDGVPDQQDNYAASGFRSAGGTVRFSGVVSPAPDTDTRPANESDIAGLIRQEAEASGYRKEAYLTAWFKDTPHRKTLITDGGFCTVRECREGSKIGPLLADTVRVARKLIQHAASLMGPKVTLDVPESSVDLPQLCQALDLKPGFATARMYRGDPPSTGSQLFATTSLELG